MSCRGGHSDDGTEAPPSRRPRHGSTTASTTESPKTRPTACAAGRKYRRNIPTEVGLPRRTQLQRTPVGERATHRNHTAFDTRHPKTSHVLTSRNIELSDTSHGVRRLSTESATTIVARRIASPAPSALRVSHPPSGFIPSQPRGLVSCHIRPQAFGLQSFFRAVSRAVSRRSVLSCHSARSQRRINPPNLPCWRLQSFAPTAQPTPVKVGLAPRRAAALLAFLLFEACRSR